MDARTGERDGLRAPVIHSEPQPRPDTGGNGESQLARAAVLVEDWQTPRERLPVLAIRGTFNLDRFQERAGRGFQSDAVERLCQAGFQGENGRS